jgi:GNAT superfamily N-acetyltransferase
MWWRITRAEFERNRSPGNKAAMREVVDLGQIPGILAYQNGEPVGWCSIAPRDDFASLNRSPVLRPIDDQPVWSIVCFYVDRKHRGQGLLEALARSAVKYAAQHGARIVEAYPTRPRGKSLSEVSSFMGIPKVLERAGFKQVAQPSEAKLIMRYTIEPRNG